MVHTKDARSEPLEKLGAEVVVGDLLEINTVRAAMKGVDAAYLVWPVATRPYPRDGEFRSSRQRNGREDHHQSFAAFRGTRIQERRVPRKLHRRASPQLVGRARYPSAPTYFLEWLLYPWQLPYLQQGVLRIPAGRGRHSPIAADDQGRAIAALLKSPEQHLGATIPLSGPVEMDHEHMAADSPRRSVKDHLREPSNRRILRVNRDDGRSAIRRSASEGAMADYQKGHMPGADNNVFKSIDRS